MISFVDKNMFMKTYAVAIPKLNFHKMLVVAFIQLKSAFFHGTRHQPLPKELILLGGSKGQIEEAACQLVAQRAIGHVTGADKHVVGLDFGKIVGGFKRIEIFVMEVTEPALFSGYD